MRINQSKNIRIYLLLEVVDTKYKKVISNLVSVQRQNISYVSIKTLTVLSAVGSQRFNQRCIMTIVRLKINIKLYSFL